MRAAPSGRLSLFASVALLGATACSDPSEPVATRATETRDHAGAIRRLPTGFFELWPGGPVVRDQGRARELVASFARRQLSQRAKAAGRTLAPAFAVVQSSAQEQLVASAEAVDVNRSGTTVGRGVSPFPSAPSPLIWAPGTSSPTDLPVSPDWVEARPTAINDGGQIAGEAQIEVSPGAFVGRAIRWDAGGGLTTLPPLQGLEHDYFVAVDIAPNGDVLGYKLNPFPPNPARVVLWQGEVPTEVGPPGVDAVPIAVNASGVILAMLDFGSGPAIRRTDGTWVSLLAPFEDGNLFATDLANDGTVVGGIFTDAGYQIVRWAPDGTPSVLPPPNPDQSGYASAINNQGTILLTIFDPGIAHPVPYVLDEGDYSPLAAELPAAESASWDLELHAISDGNVAVGTWRDEFSNGYGVRWSISFPNEPPVGLAGGPYSSVEGTSIGFAGSAFDPTPTGSLSATWTFGDGGSASGLTPSHAYADNGNYTATLSVTDGEFTVTTTTLVSVTNAAPVITVPSAETATAGVSYTLSAGFADAGAADGPWSYVVDWGDGATTQATQATSGPIFASRLYKQAGNFTIQVTVRDKDGAIGSANYPVSVLKRNGRPRP
jgi:PKD domain